MRHTTHAPHGPFLLLLLVAACQPDYALPENAQVTCTTNADCPPAWQCRTNIGRCVRNDAVPEKAPALAEGSTAVTPRSLRSGTVTVSFATDRALAQPPAVTAEPLEGDPLSATAGADDAVSLGWRTTFDVAETTPEQVFSVRATLVGLDGQQSIVSLGQFEVDRTQPLAPVKAKIVVRWRPGSTWDPASPYEVEVEGLAGALVEAGVLRAYRTATGETPVVVRPSRTDGGFDALVVAKDPLVPPNSPLDVFVALVDPAGNESERTKLDEDIGGRVLAPSLNDSYLTHPDAAVRPGALFQLFGFIQTPDAGLSYIVKDASGEREIVVEPRDPLIPPPVVTVPETEGPGLFAIRQRITIGSARGFGSGSTAESWAVIHDVDGQPPTVQAERITVDERVDGLALSGAAGALSDRIGDTTRSDASVLCFIQCPADAMSIGARCFPPWGASGGSAVPGFDVASDGSFVPAAVPALFPGHTLCAVDPAGNLVAFDMLPVSDGNAPTITDFVAEPTVVKQGEPVRLRFSAGDATSALDRLPVVRFGGVTATRVSGELAAAGGASSFVYDVAVADPQLLGDVEASVSVVDTSGVPAHAHLRVRIDGSAPSVVVEGPVGDAAVNGVLGRASDDVGVAAVEWSASRASDGFSWTAPAFAEGEFWHRVETADVFRLGPDVLPPAGQPFEFKVRAIDLAGRVSAPVVRSLTLGATNPAHVGVKATVRGERWVRVEWEPDPGSPPGTPLTTRVSFRRAGASAWNGSSALLGDSPVTVGGTSVDFTDLDRGHWEFRVEPVRGGDVGPASAVVSAPSPAWVEVTGPDGELALGLGSRGSVQVLLTRGDLGDPAAIYVRNGEGAWRLAHTFSSPYASDPFQRGLIGWVGYWFVGLFVESGTGVAVETVFSTDEGVTWRVAGGDDGPPAFPNSGCDWAGGTRTLLTDLIDPDLFMIDDPAGPWVQRPVETASSFGALACLPNGAVRHGRAGQLRTQDRGRTFHFERAASLPGIPWPEAPVFVAVAGRESVSFSQGQALHASADDLGSFSLIEAVNGFPHWTREGTVVVSAFSGDSGSFVPFGGAPVRRPDLVTPLVPLEMFAGGIVLYDIDARRLLFCSGDCSERRPYTTVPFELPSGVDPMAPGRSFSTLGTEDALHLVAAGRAAVFGPLR